MHGTNEHFFNAFLKTNAKEGGRHIAVRIDNYRHHNKPWGYEHRVTDAMDSAYARSNQTAKNKKIEGSGDDWGKKTWLAMRNIRTNSRLTRV